MPQMLHSLQNVWLIDAVSQLVCTHMKPGKLPYTIDSLSVHQGRAWEMARGGFENRPGSRGHVSPWMGAGATPLLGDEAPKTLQSSNI